MIKIKMYHEKTIYKERKVSLFNPNVLPFQQCHASTIVVLPNQDKLVAFFAGEKEGASGTAIWIVKESGAVWQAARKIIDEPYTALWNPVLYAQDHCVWLFYKSGMSVQQWITKVVVSLDQGKSWSQPFALVEGASIPRGPVKNKPIRLTNGDWLAPNSLEAGKFWDAFVDRSSDKGQTWDLVAVPLKHQRAEINLPLDNLWKGLSAGVLWETESDKVFTWDGVIQPALWESSTGQVHMLMRSTRGQIYRSDSCNFGRNWNEAYATSLPNNNSALDLVAAEGCLFLVSNPVSGNWGARSPLSITISNDNGLTWRDPIPIETGEGEYSYPAVVYHQGAIHLTYSNNRQSIIYQKWNIN